jgi:hypothetical protein
MVKKFFKEFDEIYFTTHALKNVEARKSTLLTKQDLLHKESQLISFFEQAPNKKRGFLLKSILVRVCHLSQEKDFYVVTAKDGWVITTWANEKSRSRSCGGRDPRYATAKKKYAWSRSEIRKL